MSFSIIGRKVESNMKECIKRGASEHALILIRSKLDEARKKRKYAKGLSCSADKKRWYQRSLNVICVAEDLTHTLLDHLKVTVI